MKNTAKIFIALLLAAILTVPACAKTATLVLLAHGETEADEEGRVTGWFDTRLSLGGVKHSFDAGDCMKEAGLEFDEIHTSYLDRDVNAAWLATSALGARWLPMTKYWRLNARFYGSLEGKLRSEIVAASGDQQTSLWLESYDAKPPAMAADDERSPHSDPRYASFDRRIIPLSESLKDTVTRIGPYWNDVLLPALNRSSRVLVVAHESALRALSSWIDESLDVMMLLKIEIPSATPIIYTLEVKDGRAEVVSRELLAVKDRQLPQTPQENGQVDEKPEKGKEKAKAKSKK